MFGTAVIAHVLGNFVPDLFSGIFLGFPVKILFHFHRTAAARTDNGTCQVNSENHLCSSALL